MNKKRPNPAGMDRRALLTGLGAGAITSLAGCIGDGDDVGDVEIQDTDPAAPGVGDVDTDDVEIDDDVLPEDVFIEDQELRIITGQNPEEAHFIWLPGGSYGAFDQAGRVYQATHEPGVWDRSWHQSFWPNPGGTHLGYYDSVEIEEETITAVIRDDAYWSDGEPMVAKDAIATYSMWVLPPDEEYGWDYPPELARVFNGAIGSFSVPDGMDGKVFQWHINDHPGWEDIGGFRGMNEGEVLRWMGGTNWPTGVRVGVGFPAHVDIWEDVVDLRIEQWEERDPDIQQRVTFLDEHMDESMVDPSREPGRVPGSGAWKLEEIVGTEEFILEQNEHFRHADRVNFERVVIEYSEDAPRTEAGLQVGRYDFATIEAGPETVAELPGRYSQVLTPSPSGHAFGVDHRGLFGDVEVRQAAMHALDTPSIAENISPESAIGIEIPGWDIWFGEAVMDESWARENLIDYSQDLDRAEELMQRAGYSRGGDDLWERDGDLLQTQIATADEDPRKELTFEGQLNDFGFDLNVQTFDGATFSERHQGSDRVEFIENPDTARGDFDIWSGSFGAGLNWELWSFWRMRIENVRQLRAFNIFPHEQQEEAVENHFLASGWSEAQYPVFEDWTVELPPIGEPDGEPTVEFNPSYTGIKVFAGHAGFEDPQLENDYYNPPHDEPHEENSEYFWQQFAWLTNWLLPTIPVALDQNQNFVNTENWLWATDHEMWNYLGIAGTEAHHIAQAEVQGNPESPKEEGTVVER